MKMFWRAAAAATTALAVSMSSLADEHDWIESSNDQGRQVRCH